MKKNIYRLLLICSLLSLCVSVFSQEWIPVCSSARGEAVTMEVLQDDASCYKVKVRINGLYDQIVNNDYGTFHRLSLGDFGRLMKVGEPSLPVITRLIAIPTGTKSSATIEDEEWTSMSIGMVFPAQKPTFDLGSHAEFSINDSVYGASFLPSTVSIGREMKWRGIKNAGVNVCPFKYYPQTNTLQVMKQFVLRVDFQTTNGQRVSASTLRRGQDIFRLFDNSVYTAESAVASRSGSSSADNYDYLIVVADTAILNSQKMKEFRRWKALMGLKSKAVPLDSIGSDTTAIKNYISTEYDKGVRYALLVGDITKITNHNVPDTFGRSSSFFVSDYWYGCIDSVEEQSVPIGRFSVSNLGEFSNMVDKTIRYESWKNLDYKALLIAHKECLDSNYYYRNYQACCDSIKNRQYSESLPFVTAYGRYMPFTNAYVTSIINQGAHIVNYRGHASEDFWGNPTWNVSNESYLKSYVDSMQQNTNAVFLSVACNTGNLLSNTCMLEKFTRSSNGAAAFMGSSTESDNEMNSDYNEFLYKHLLDSTTYRLGDLNMVSFISLYRKHPFHDYIMKNAYSYICGGDPSLELWTASPQTLTGVDVTTSGGNVVVKVPYTGFRLYVSSMDGELIDSVTTLGKTKTFAKPAGNFCFSLKKHNWKPFIVYCDPQKHFLQNVDIDYNGFYDNSPFAAGEAVGEGDLGNVTVKDGSNLYIKLGYWGVLLDEGFKVEKGASITIK